MKDGKVFFQMDVPDKEPIFHGMRQEQGMSIAKQEELKKQQESEQRYQQELEHYKKDREHQMEINNQYSIDAKEKREKFQKANEESSRKMSAKDVIMEQARKHRAQKSNSFMESLRFNVENTNRTNQLQSQNQSNSRKRSNSMGMSR